MVTGKTASGFEFSVDPAFTDNWEIAQLFKRQYDGDEFAFMELYPRILGSEQFERLTEHVKTPEGRIPTSAINTEMMEIINAVKEIKK